MYPCTESSPVETGFYYLNSRYYDPTTGRFINADGLVSTGQGVLGYNMFAYCNNNPINRFDPNGYSAAFVSTIGDSSGNTLEIVYKALSQVKVIMAENDKSKIDPKEPPDHPDYDPKIEKGKDNPEKVKNPNGSGTGWPAKDGGVWMPDNDMHGGPGWVVQRPGGGHEHAYPGGHIRKATLITKPNPVGGTVLFVFGLVATVFLIADNITGIGIADDWLVPAAAGCMFVGLDQVGGYYYCEVCEESWYGIR